MELNIDYETAAEEIANVKQLASLLDCEWTQTWSTRALVTHPTIETIQHFKRTVSAVSLDYVDTCHIMRLNDCFGVELLFYK